jgi:hypothetical protein
MMENNSDFPNLPQTLSILAVRFRLELLAAVAQLIVSLILSLMNYIDPVEPT